MAWKSELAYGADDIYGAYFGPKNQEGGRTVSRAKKFEVAVYNKEVRKLVKEGERHRHFTDDWAGIHYVDIMARDEREARVKVENRYPEHKGFVIDSVSVSNDLP